MSILEYNGGALVALAGKECIAIACDKRLGSNSLATVEMNMEKIFPVTQKTLVGAVGLISDVQTVSRTLRFHKNLFYLKEEREMKPLTVCTLLSNLLYRKRFSPWFVDCIVAGLTEDNQPYIGSVDISGGMARSNPKFAVSGTAADSIVAMCEASWTPDLSPEDLFQVTSQCLLAGLDRDCFSGWGAVVYILTPTELICRHIKTRMD